MDQFVFKCPRTEEVVGVLDNSFSSTPEGGRWSSRGPFLPCQGEEDERGEHEMEQERDSCRQLLRSLAMIFSLVLQVTLANDPGMDSGTQSGKITLH